MTVTDAGQFNLNSLYLGNGTTMTMHGGDVVNNQIDLTGNSATHRGSGQRHGPDVERDVAEQPDDRPELD